MTAATLTAAEITDTRLDVIGHARDVHARALTELEARRRPPRSLQVTAALTVLKGALRAWDNATSCEKDEAVRMCGLRTVQLVAVVEDVFGWDAAEWVSRGDDEEEEGTR